MADITMEYEVEKVIHKKRCKDGVWYVVKWGANVPGPRYDWVHEANMTCPELIEEFENSDGVHKLDCKSEYLQACIDELQEQKNY